MENRNYPPSTLVDNNKIKNRFMEETKYVNYIYHQLYMLLRENGFGKEANVVSFLKNCDGDREKIEVYSSLLVLREKIKWIKRVALAYVATTTICVLVLLLMLLMR